jgi:hypothetical protein
LEVIATGAATASLGVAQRKPGAGRVRWLHPDATDLPPLQAHLALLLMFTFVIGTGSVLTTPAYQSLVPELVPRDQIPAAAQPSSINVNIARVIGPSMAGS